jgi:membrane-associated protein
VLAQYGLWTYAILLLVVFLETGIVVTPFLPGDSLLFAAGALAAGSTTLDVGWLFILLGVAAILGDTVNYHIGAFIGPRAFQGSRWLNQAHLDRTRYFYERHGGKTIVLARFIPIIRTFAPFVAGIGCMAYRQFLFYNVFGAALWTGLFLFAGYFFGSMPVVQKNFTLVILAIIALSLMPPCIEFLRLRRQRPGVVPPVHSQKTP